MAFSEDYLENFMRGFYNSLEDLKCTTEDCRCKCAREYEDEEEDDETEMDTDYESLCEEYRTCMNWGFGISHLVASKEKARKIWVKRHPNFPIPRVLKSKNNAHERFAPVALIMDVYPMWKAYMKEKEKNG